MLTNRSTNTRVIGVSVVMAVYKNDRASWVRQAIDSVLNQTLQPDEVIVVVDGEIPKGIQKVLDSYSGGGVKQIPLDENRGLWNALNDSKDNPWILIWIPRIIPGFHLRSGRLVWYNCLIMMCFYVGVIFDGEKERINRAPIKVRAVELNLWLWGHYR